MPLRIAINGARGRMGRQLAALVRAQPDCVLTAAWERPDHPDQGRDLGELDGGAPVGVTLAPPGVGACDVAVDFSLPAGARAVLAALCDRPTPLVVCTTGLGAEHEALAARLAARAPVLITANTSVGVTVLEALVRRAAAALPPAFALEVVELHHDQKRDAPSGTALTLARAAAQARGLDLPRHAVYGRQGDTGPRPADAIGLHSLRGGDVVGEHSVYFLGPGERVVLQHQATTREVFARGALTAARALAARPAGRYTMAQVLGLE